MICAAIAADGACFFRKARDDISSLSIDFRRAFRPFCYWKVAVSKAADLKVSTAIGQEEFSV